MAGYIKAIADVARASITLRSHLRRLEHVDYDAFYTEFNIDITRSEYFHSKAHFNRCRQYVKAFGLLALSLADLLGRKITEQEFKSLLLLAHFAPVFDDLFDKEAMHLHRMKAFITRPDKQRAGSELEHLFLSYYIPFHDLVPEQHTSEQHLVRLAETEKINPAQEDGKETQNPESTLWKGGHSCLVIRAIFPEKITTEEEKALFRLGMLTQAMDDVFDAADDLAANKTTFISVINDPLEIRRYYLTGMQAFFQAMHQTQHDKDLISRFINQANVLLSPALNCISLYQKMSLSNFNREEFSKYEREELVCDMESKQQIINLLKNSIKNRRLLV